MAMAFARFQVPRADPVSPVVAHASVAVVPDTVAVEAKVPGDEDEATPHASREWLPTDKPADDDNEAVHNDDVLDAAHADPDAHDHSDDELDAATLPSLPSHTSDATLTASLSSLMLGTDSALKDAMAHLTRPLQAHVAAVEAQRDEAVLAAHAQVAKAAEKVALLEQQLQSHDLELHTKAGDVHRAYAEAARLKDKYAAVLDENDALREENAVAKEQLAGMAKHAKAETEAARRKVAAAAREKQEMLAALEAAHSENETLKRRLTKALAAAHNNSPNGGMSRRHRRWSKLRKPAASSSDDDSDSGASSVVSRASDRARAPTPTTTTSLLLEQTQVELRTVQEHAVALEDENRALREELAVLGTENDELHLLFEHSREALAQLEAERDLVAASADLGGSLAAEMDPSRMVPKFNQAVQVDPAELEPLEVAVEDVEVTPRVEDVAAALAAAVDEAETEFEAEAEPEPPAEKQDDEAVAVPSPPPKLVARDVPEAPAEPEPAADETATIADSIAVAAPESVADIAVEPAASPTPKPQPTIRVSVDDGSVTIGAEAVAEGYIILPYYLRNRVDRATQTRGGTTTTRSLSMPSLGDLLRTSTPPVPPVPSDAGGASPRPGGARSKLRPLSSVELGERLSEIQNMGRHLRARARTASNRGSVARLSMVADDDDASVRERFEALFRAPAPPLPTSPPALLLPALGSATPSAMPADLVHPRPQPAVAARELSTIMEVPSPRASRGEAMSPEMMPSNLLSPASLCMPTLTRVKPGASPAMPGAVPLVPPARSQSAQLAFESKLVIASNGASSPPTTTGTTTPASAPAPAPKTPPTTTRRSGNRTSMLGPLPRPLPVPYTTHMMLTPSYYADDDLDDDWSTVIGASVVGNAAKKRSWDDPANAAAETGSNATSATGTAVAPAVRARMMKSYSRNRRSQALRASMIGDLPGAPAAAGTAVVPPAITAFSFGAGGGNPFTFPSTSSSVALGPASTVPHADARAHHLSRLFLGTWMLKADRRDRNLRPRFFWINHTDLREDVTVMWAKTNPFVKDAKEKKPKEAVFKCLTIMDVWQSNRGLKKTILRNSPKSKGAKRDSTNMDVETLLIINTGTRQLHLRAPTPEDHEAWFQGLSFLVDERRKAQALPHDSDEKAAAALANAGARPPTQFKAAATAVMVAGALAGRPSPLRKPRSGSASASNLGGTTSMSSLSVSAVGAPPLTSASVVESGSHHHHHFARSSSAASSLGVGAVPLDPTVGPRPRAESNASSTAPSTTSPTRHAAVAAASSALCLSWPLLRKSSKSSATDAATHGTLLSSVSDSSYPERSSSLAAAMTVDRVTSPTAGSGSTVSRSGSRSGASSVSGSGSRSPQVEHGSGGTTSRIASIMAKMRNGNRATSSARNGSGSSASSAVGAPIAE
ncbi:hypothetical protein AMAG_20558 [Allomyces macrogynus ATCC 38327]|uniref:Pleckstrin homology domain-containing protein n=1 Tax=Allomyces macrogynus (strain ATCC 38327) TaxID=578462 RepID=A0A0L0TBN5_ALLM3|nr:hypothetical protein AMAG_20558 [Allomyces macrogynus ATCC 38327]|eukprot:KNE72223.1 hypothetical protein AMAG_20558 [Allomyces macrogynus ATCC 38327]